MARSTASTPEQYLAALPPDRRILLGEVRELVRDNMPGGYQESVNWGAITWDVPLSVYPDTYNGQPMCYAALASHKTTATLYLMGAYSIPALRKRLEDGFKAAGKRLDMGKSCLHFKSMNDLPRGLIAEIIAAVPMSDYVARVRAAKAGAGGKAARKTARKTAGKTARKRPRAKGR